MKTLFALSIGLLLFASCDQDTIVSESEGINVDQSSFTKSGDRVDICHKGRIKNITFDSLSDHQGHGDAIDMDGDGYFDIENDCSDTDCDDTTYSEDNTCGTPAAIGDLRAGGVVFWVDPIDNTHGLVCALEDYATRVEWGCVGTDLPSVPNVTIGDPVGLGAEIGDGMANTNGILAATDCPSAPAALAARSFGPEWFLPSILELNEIYLNRETLDAVAGFSALQDVQGLYWSSTEYDDTTAWVIIYSFGILNIANKDDPFWIVRAVRAF